MIRRKTQDVEPASGADAPEYETRDVGFAALLACKGIHPTRIEQPKPNSYPPFASIIFEQTPELLETVEVWSSNGTTTLSPKTYEYHRRELFRQVRAVAQQSVGGR
jgi:hypothetical protein